MWWRKRQPARPISRVLVCGMENHVVRSFQRAFERKGAEVIAVSTRTEVLTTLRDQPCEFVILSHGLSGIEGLADEIREIPGCEGTRVIVSPQPFNFFDPPSSFLPGPPGVLAISTERFKKSLRKLRL